MKYFYYDPETNKEYDCENEYEFKIKYLQKNMTITFGMMR